MTGPKLKRGSRHSLLIRLHSHREKPDELFVQLGPPGEIPAEPEDWTLSNTKGSSAANLSRVILRGDAADFAGFENVRIAPTREGLATAKVVAEGADDTAAEREFEAVLARFRSGTVTLPDSRQMNWHRRTGTGPSLVLIPGTWGDLQSFAPLLAKLPGDMPVFVVELCWQGRPGSATNRSFNRRTCRRCSAGRQQTEHGRFLHQRPQHWRDDHRGNRRAQRPRPAGSDPHGRLDSSLRHAEGICRSRHGRAQPGTAGPPRQGSSPRPGPPEFRSTECHWFYLATLERSRQSRTITGSHSAHLGRPRPPPTGSISTADPGPTTD